MKKIIWILAILVIFISNLVSHSAAGSSPPLESSYNFPSVNANTKKQGIGAYIDKTGKILRYEENEIDTDDYYIPKYDNKTELYGFVNKKDKWVIKPQFDNVEPHAVLKKDSLISVSQYRKWGVINNKGKQIIPFEYNNYIKFYEGLASACIYENWGNNKCGYIDEKNNWIIKPQFDFALNFSEDYAVVLKDNKWGFIDKNGKIVIEPQFPNVLCLSQDPRGNWFPLCKQNSEFKEGLAPIYYDFDYEVKRKGAKTINNYTAVFPENFVKEPKKTVYGYISNGKFTVVNNPDDYKEKHIIEGIIIPKYKNGYTNKKGEIVIELGDVYSMGGFSEGLAPVCKYYGYCGYIDKTGNFVIKPQFMFADEFKNGETFVRIRNK